MSAKTKKKAKPAAEVKPEVQVRYVVQSLRAEAGASEWSDCTLYGARDIARALTKNFNFRTRIVKVTTTTVREVVR